MHLLCVLYVMKICVLCVVKLLCDRLDSLQGMDELTPMGSADVVEVTQSNINRYCLEPKDLGISR